MGGMRSRFRRPCRLLSAVLAMALALPAAAQSAPPGEAPAGARVGEIRIVRHDVFDTRIEGENKRAYRFANRLHRRTHEPVIERLLLFAPGEAYDPALLEETARLLRAQGYLREAEVTCPPFSGPG